MLAFPIVESALSEEVFHLAVNLYRSARRAGFTIRSPLAVLYRDRDFDGLARVSPLEVARL